jgi:hypothetical protein
MTVMPDIDAVVLGPTVARLAIRLRAGVLVVHDLHEVETRRLRDQLDAALERYELPPQTMPSWAGGEPFFGQEIRDEFDCRRSGI